MTLFALLGLPWFGWTFGLSLVGLLWWSISITSRRDGAARGGAVIPKMFPTAASKARDEDVRDLSIGAVLSAMWGFPVDTLATGAHAAEMQGVLAESWDVKTGADSKTTLRWLLDVGHRDAFDVVLRFVGPDPSKASVEQLEEELGGNAAARLEEPLGNFIETHDELKRRGYIESPSDLDRGTSAWDYSRAVTVARFCHTAGYLTEEEAWGFIREAGERARSEFGSWAEFHKSYVIGRAVWNGMSQLDNPNLRSVIDAVSDAHDSPWKKVSWS
ncbi:hypothetical protein Poly30_05680 [Planctomycetes bacterium Poly30]|uniref:DUF1266 domain-containing protein n=1 Tax=Saltatorellus ferox TaxID=2528018 RepID=A0A518ELV8_9BACT|nr:hypothetical protein Poly30_05680 [Planctomycetes bacterium Poly30]